MELDAITGRGLVMLAERLPLQRPDLLRQATRLLHARAHTPTDATPQRSALRHGAWLSLAHLSTDDLDRADHAARLALARLPEVNSARSVALLHRVAARVERVARRSAAAQRLLGDLRSALR